MSEALQAQIDKLAKEKQKDEKTERIKTSSKMKKNKKLEVKDKTLFKTLKERIGVSDKNTERLVKIIEELREKIDDDNIKDKHKLGKETLDKAESILHGSELHAFGEYVNKEFRKKGVELPPPPGGSGSGGGRPPR